MPLRTQLALAVFVDAVKGVLEARLARMRDRPTGQPESPFEQARREALASAQEAQLRIWLRAMISETERQQGMIPFAIDAQGRLYAPERKDEDMLAALGMVPGRPASALLAGGDWVTAVRRTRDTGIVIGVARPMGAALVEFRQTAARN